MKFITITTLFLVAAISSTFACECGLEGSGGRRLPGSEILSSKYPWLAQIQLGGIFSFDGKQCGGSLIDDQHILTTAKCIKDEYNESYAPEEIKVYFGELYGFHEESKAYLVSDVYVHPEYNRISLANDFAMLTLAESVNFTSVCLPENEETMSERLVASGFGRPFSGLSFNPNDVLFESDATYMDKTECDNKKIDYFADQRDIPRYIAHEYEWPHLPKGLTCAINQKTLGDACTGDIGSPLMHKGEDGRYFLMGSVSNSWSECGYRRDTFGLYTRPVYHKDTIKSMAPNACWKSY